VIPIDQFGNLRAPMRGGKSAIKREHRESSRRQKVIRIQKLRRNRPTIENW
jgi:hypothetical protein